MAIDRPCLRPNASASPSLQNYRKPLHMTEILTAIQPAEVWRHFETLNAVPRPSKKEARIIAFMEGFGRQLGLETETDEVGNVLIRKPASPGKEGLSPIALQAHLDMVHQKNTGTDFDFDTQGIRMLIDGDWVRAQGTTLGADNGLGVAAIMAVLASDDIEHPPLEALFTIDEETGMTGAKALKPGWLKAGVLLNLDTEEDDVLTVGCAGGIDVTGSGSYDEIPVPTNWIGVKVTVKGLQGGHSGMDIHRGRGNANKLLGRLLQVCSSGVEIRLGRFQGGNLRNAIPRESEAIIALDPSQLSALKQVFEHEASLIRAEYAPEEPGLMLEMEGCEVPRGSMSAQDQRIFLNTVSALRNGVYFMSYAFPEQTETSNNLARVMADGGIIELGCLTRSSGESRKADLVRSLQAVLELAGYQMTTSGDYPGWEPDPGSSVLQLLIDRYRALFGEEPKVEAGHGGLECGIIKAAYPNMDMISFGPTILGAHSPDERACISSTQKFWTFFKDVLATIG